MDDGVRDAIIGNPLGCALDPSKFLCASESASDCLKKHQVEAVRKIYEGPSTSRGERVSTRGFLPGSEINWRDWKQTGIKPAEEFFRYALFIPSPGSAWNAKKFDFDNDYKRLGIGVFYANTNPDLRKFKARGGKLIAYQGATDAVQIPGAIYDYYETTERTMGGRNATQEFFRLFTVPGMDHCLGGVGAYSIDYLSYLEAWVEREQAPDKMIGARVSDAYLESQHHPHGPLGAAWALQYPLDSSIPVTFTRPVYPHPLYARYAGRGDKNNAASFIAVDPASKGRE